MVLNKELLVKYKDYLISLDYPFIKQQNDADIQKIFEKENRNLLLIFLIKKYLPSCANKIEEEVQKDNKIENFLINMIYDNGFCRSAEKEPFVKGTLDEDKEIIIFNKIFHMLTLLHANPEPEITEEDLKLKQAFIKSSDEFKNQIIPEVNLFKTLGLPNKMTDEKRNEKIQAYKEEIDNFNNILKLKEKEVKQLEIETTCDLLNADDIAKLVNDFKNNAGNFNLDDFVKFTDNKTGIKANSTKTELEQIVTAYSKEIHSLLKTFQKKGELNQFISEENLSGNDESISNDHDYSSSILLNYVMSNKIIEEANRNSEN